MVLNGRFIACALVFAMVGGALGCQPLESEPLVSDLLASDFLASGALVAGVDAAAPAARDTVTRPVLKTYADTVAMRVYDASGGPAAWEALPFLGFNFSVMRQNERGRVFRHFWDRRTGAYRAELPGPANEPYVALFNVDTREGRVYWQGTELDTVETPKMLDEAYRRYINDTYWLLLPFKLFDPGVNRTYVPDSSDASFDVVHLSFGNVGLTPGDQYWLYVDKETGRLARWTYVLESYGPDTPPRSFVWEDYEEHVTPEGSLFFATRKRGIGVPFAILTNEITTPSFDQVPDDIFTAIEARLTPVDSTASPFVPGGTRPPASQKSKN